MTGTDPEAVRGTGRTRRSDGAPETQQPERPWRSRAPRFATLWPTMVMGGALWVLLWGDLSWANVLSGVALGALVALAFPLPPVGTAGTLRPGPLAHLVGRFASDLVVASFQVAWTAVRPGPTPQGGLVEVPLRSTSELLVAITAGLSSMVPGTVVVDLDRSGATLQVHVLDLAGSGGPDGVRESVRALEGRLLRAFVTRAELVRLGLAEPSDGPAPTPGKEGQP
ncbi:Na+/H+ antiporter subunit E [Promicromonospora iranensis]|uniref:Multicomponent Na+:H+ antiporter subunit E n=1 Tax=Promicromonospora iranensis TaxID=1105144 RepID=A0ABU2CS22_9MICO|nr:Na+/H+ antiporter subunit E [Promicromonospora iranensis]MDR7384134.1 multicomponent Na+:H+ antiporter subunit E [Promicromonospora iranensis]